MKLPAARQQKKLIKNIIRDVPEAKGMLGYVVEKIQKQEKNCYNKKEAL